MSAQQDLDDDLPAQPSPDAATFRAAFSTSFIVAAAVISLLVVFLILLLQVYAKLLWSRSSRSAAVRRGLASAAPAAGLGAAAIAALPTFTHASKASLLECAVCLSEFQGDEQGRTLPSCSHSFHVECIDMWLSSHTTCPLCRADVLRAAAPPAAAHHAATDGQEARGAEEEEERVAGSNPVQLPCNVLVWGDEAHVNLQQQQQEVSSSSSPSAIRPRNRSLPQITIAIPPMDGRVVLTIATPRQHSLSKADQAASSSSQPAPARSPGLGRFPEENAEQEVERAYNGLLYPTSTLSKKAFANKRSRVQTPVLRSS